MHSGRHRKMHEGILRVDICTHQITLRSWSAQSGTTAAAPTTAAVGVLQLLLLHLMLLLLLLLLPLSPELIGSSAFTLLHLPLI